MIHNVREAIALLPPWRLGARQTHWDGSPSVSPIRRNRDGSRYPVKNPLICRRKRGRPTCPAALPPVHLGRNDEMRKLIAGAIELHLSGMRKDGEPVPEPSFFEMVEVAG
jgi:hypothetical protein